MGTRLSILQHSPGKYMASDFNVTDLRRYSACQRFSASLFIVVRPQPPKRPPSIGEVVRSVEEGVEEIMLRIICSSSRGRNAEAGPILQPLCSVLPILWLWVNLPFSLELCTDHVVGKSLIQGRKWDILQNTGQRTFMERSKMLSEPA